MKIIFTDTDLAYIYKYGKEKGKPSFSSEVVKGFIKKVNLLLDVKNSAELRLFKGARYEQLSGDLKGYESIRINSQFGILIKIQTEKEEKQISEVCYIHKITDYH